jgi:DNA primase
MRLTPEFIDRVRESTDIAAVIAEHVQLKRTGKTWKALCPFHQEKTPSFHVNPDRQIFKCFGCGEGGDVLHFVMQFEKLSFPEAVELLAGRAGIPLPPRGGFAPAEEQSVYPVLEWAATLYRRELDGRTGEAARAYLERRGIGRETVERFGLGWAPAGWSFLVGAAEKRYAPPLLQRAGLAVENDRGGFYDRFRGRLVIPIRSPLGRAIGFGARTLGDEEPKYLNSPETEVFTKGRTLYGLPEAREALKARGEAIVVEGYLDAITLSQAGFTHVVASCGTAFTEDQARVLRRYVDRALLVFDGDLAGLRAAWKSAGVFLGVGLDVRVLGLPEGHDPDSYVRSQGAEAMTTLVDRAPGVVGFAHDVLLDRLERREDLLKALAYLGSRIGDPIRRRILLQEAAERFRFDEETLSREAARQSGGGTRPAPKAPVPEGGVEPKDLLGRTWLAGVMTREAVAENELLPPGAILESRIRMVYERWSALRAAGEKNPRGRLLEDPETRSLTAEVLSAEEGEAAFAVVTGRLRERLTRARGKALESAIREAESQGDREAAERLLKELHALKEARL